MFPAHIFLFGSCSLLLQGPLGAELLSAGSWLAARLAGWLANRGSALAGTAVDGSAAVSGCHLPRPAATCWAPAAKHAPPLFCLYLPLLNFLSLLLAGNKLGHAAVACSLQPAGSSCQALLGMLPPCCQVCKRCHRRMLLRVVLAPPRGLLGWQRTPDSEEARYGKRTSLPSSVGQQQACPPHLEGALLEHRLVGAWAHQGGQLEAAGSRRSAGPGVHRLGNAAKVKQRMLHNRSGLRCPGREVLVPCTARHVQQQQRRRPHQQAHCSGSLAGAVGMRAVWYWGLAWYWSSTCCTCVLASGGSASADRTAGASGAVAGTKWDMGDDSSAVGRAATGRRQSRALCGGLCVAAVVGGQPIGAHRALPSHALQGWTCRRWATKPHQALAVTERVSEWYLVSW